MTPHTTPITRQEFEAIVARQNQADVQRCEMRQDIKQIKCDTAEVVEMFRALSGGFKVLQWLGNLARPITYIAAGIAAVYGALTVIKNGGIK